MFSRIVVQETACLLLILGIGLIQLVQSQPETFDYAHNSSLSYGSLNMAAL
jgi:hypothetical protein